jgi:hypothetical protein
MIYEGCSKRIAPHYFSQPLTKIEKCSFEGLKSDVSPARILSFESLRQIRSCSEFLKGHLLQIPVSSNEL